jgi:hypothetical protein
VSRSRSSGSPRVAFFAILLDLVLPTDRGASELIHRWTEKTVRLPKGNRFASTEGKGNLVLENQLEESRCSCSRNKAIDGRIDSRFSYSSDQLSCNRSHNPPDIPVLGLSGRIPSITCFTTPESEDVPNGGPPVSTCGSGGMEL